MRKICLFYIRNKKKLYDSTWQTHLFGVWAFFLLIVLFGCWLAGQANSDHVGSAIWIRAGISPLAHAQQRENRGLKDMIENMIDGRNGKKWRKLFQFTPSFRKCIRVKTNTLTNCADISAHVGRQESYCNHIFLLLHCLCHFCWQGSLYIYSYSRALSLICWNCLIVLPTLPSPSSVVSLYGKIDENSSAPSHSLLFTGDSCGSGW